MRHAGVGRVAPRAQAVWRFGDGVTFALEVHTRIAVHGQRTAPLSLA
jgi:hypothetical protein